MGQYACLECSWTPCDGWFDRPIRMDLGSFIFLASIIWAQYQAGATDAEMLPDMWWEVAEIDTSIPSAPRVYARDGFLQSTAAPIPRVGFRR